MRNYSSFISKTDYNAVIKESRYCLILALSLFLSGIIMLLIPILNLDGSMVLAESWILVVALGFTILRPLLFRRGLADLSMVIVTSILYIILELSFSFAFRRIEDFKLILSFMLFMLGISRIIAFAQIVNKVHFPVLIVTGISEVVAAIIIFAQWPSGSYGMIYWSIGMTILITSFEYVHEALRLKTGA